MTTEDRTGPDLGAVFDEHVADEFVVQDVAATMATMTPEPTVLHVPSGAGGSGQEAVAAFYTDHFIGQWPDDTVITRLSRTVDAERVVDEMFMTFTHDRVIDAFLPGVAPTGRPVELLVVGIIGFRDGLVDYEHLYWDQASLLVQIGLLDPAGLPVLGVEQARALRPAAVRVGAELPG
ncbi:nuclear transport factor 2 family protein [Actinomycetospora chiangmaiensis]|uniref:nuclear transport factor 2 family protein n=1 Tax=Actinomycetospora chiangmaiensis TaxID=402650 RepID=UPI0003607042|nr:nuclear transport factor 2 family protein [Actinomycetospora chiangmaiensis]